MAYSNNPLDPTGRSILTQVAFKGAVELASAGKIETSEVGAYTVALAQELTDAVKAQSDEYFASVPEAVQAPNVEQIMADEFGATTVATEGVKVLGEQHGPLPSWLIAQCKAAGVTRVFDNRATKKGNQPWFKTPKDASKNGEPDDKPFWPPRD